MVPWLLIPERNQRRPLPSSGKLIMIPWLLHPRKNRRRPLFPERNRRGPLSGPGRQLWSRGFSFQRGVNIIIIMIMVDIDIIIMIIFMFTLINIIVIVISMITIIQHHQQVVSCDAPGWPCVSWAAGTSQSLRRAGARSASRSIFFVPEQQSVIN